MLQIPPLLPDTVLQYINIDGISTGSVNRFPHYFTNVLLINLMTCTYVVTKNRKILKFYAGVNNCCKGKQVHSSLSYSVLKLSLAAFIHILKTISGISQLQHGYSQFCTLNLEAVGWQLTVDLKCMGHCCFSLEWLPQPL